MKRKMIKKVFKNQYIFSLVTKAILVLIGVLNSVLINRYLGPSLKGEYSYLLNIVNIIVLILNLGMYQSYPNFRKKEIINIQNKYFNIFMFQFLIYILIGSGFSFIIKDVKFTIILTLVPFMVFTKQISFIAMIEDVLLRNLITIINQMIYTFALIFVFFLMPKSYMFPLLLLYLKNIIIISLIYIKYNFKISFKELDFVLLKKIIYFGIYPMISVLMITANYKIDVIILKYFVDFKNIGYYTVGVGLANQLWIIPDAFKDVLFSKSAKNDSKKEIITAIKFNLYISLFIFISIFFSGKFIIRVLYGVEFVKAYKVLNVIFIGIIPMIFFKLINVDFISNGRQKISFLILIISVIFNVGSNFILIPIFGIIGAALASVISYSLCGGIFLLVFMKIYHLSIKEILIPTRDELIKLRCYFK